MNLLDKFVESMIKKYVSPSQFYIMKELFTRSSFIFVKQIIGARDDKFNVKEVAHKSAQLSSGKNKDDRTIMNYLKNEAKNKVLKKKEDDQLASSNKTLKIKKTRSIKSVLKSNIHMKSKKKNQISKKSSKLILNMNINSKSVKKYIENELSSSGKSAEDQNSIPEIDQEQPTLTDKCESVMSENELDMLLNDCLNDSKSRK